MAWGFLYPANLSCEDLTVGFQEAMRSFRKYREAGRDDGRYEGIEREVRQK
jgi:hypothetical protein